MVVVVKLCSIFLDDFSKCPHTHTLTFCLIILHMYIDIYTYQYQYQYFLHFTFYLLDIFFIFYFFYICCVFFSSFFEVDSNVLEERTNEVSLVGGGGDCRA